MGVPLFQYSRRYVVDRAGLAASLAAPVLLWETAAADPLLVEEHYQPTDAGRHLARPRAGDTLVFEVVKGQHAANVFPMGITVGRLDNNDLVVDDASLSRFHAWFHHDERKGVWALADADSKNGTKVAGVAVPKGQKVPLTDGAVVEFGDVAMRFFQPAGFLGFLDALVNARF